MVSEVIYFLVYKSLKVLKKFKLNPWEEEFLILKMFRKKYKALGGGKREIPLTWNRYHLNLIDKNDKWEKVLSLYGPRPFRGDFMSVDFKTYKVFQISH